MLTLITEIFVLIAAVAAAFFCLFAVLVVLAMLREQNEVPKLIDFKNKKKHTTALDITKEFLKQRGE